jgi:hypothetical protein
MKSRKVDADPRRDRCGIAQARHASVIKRVPYVRLIQVRERESRDMDQPRHGAQSARAIAPRQSVIISCIDMRLARQAVPSLRGGGGVILSTRPVFSCSSETTLRRVVLVRNDRTVFLVARFDAASAVHAAPDRLETIAQASTQWLRATPPGDCTRRRTGPGFKAKGGQSTMRIDNHLNSYSKLGKAVVVKKPWYNG